MRPERWKPPERTTHMLGGALRTGLCLISLAAAGASAADAEPAVVFTVEGTGFTIRELADGARAFGNRDYVWENVPARLREWKFTRLDGGRRSRLTVTAAADGVVHVATATVQPGVDMTGWKEARSLRFNYTDRNRSAMVVFTRACRAGTRLTVPQGNWSGTMVIAPGLKGKAMGEAQDAPAGGRSRDHSKVPGVVIHHSPARTRRYIGCPGIAVLRGGDYVASHSFFGRGSTRNRTCVHRSRDAGKSWERLTEIVGQWWSSLFVHDGALYLMGPSRSYGFVVIRRSIDGGKTWTVPKDGQTGLLLGDGRYHCAPVPVVVHKGRIWRAMEDAMGPGRWGSHFRSFVMSAPADADLLKVESWTTSTRLGRDPKWLGGKFGGWLEGNAVVTPDRRIVNVLRVDCPDGGKAAMVRVSDDGKVASFDPGNDFIDFPGGSKKFTIRYDPRTRLYWSLVNHVKPGDRGKNRRASLIRNHLALASSPDLRSWTVGSTILYHPDAAKHAFQYVDWLFEGDDLIAVSRTAYDDGLGGAHNQHDANYLTFHRIEGFRGR